MPESVLLSSTSKPRKYSNHVFDAESANVCLPLPPVTTVSLGLNISEGQGPEAGGACQALRCQVQSGLDKVKDPFHPHLKSLTNALPKDRYS